MIKRLFSRELRRKGRSIEKFLGAREGERERGREGRVAFIGARERGMERGGGDKQSVQ